ncbi:MAG TPA: hypothetical protein VMS54_05210 [Vicinamibacterales bacterium]|nr:hypothetical protein [Vicinamibacterales bacterium]
MRRVTFLPLTLMAVLTLASSACDSGENTPTTPTTPGPTITETFAGTVTQNGAATFTFNTTVSGIVNATLKSIGPVTTAQVGMALGTWNGVTCAVVLANDRITTGLAVTGQVNAAGSLCVRIYDVGQLTETSTFEVVVVHP